MTRQVTSGPAAFAATRCILGLLTTFLVMPSDPALACVGDCNESGTITVDEVIMGVSIALGLRPLDDCRPFDRNSSNAVEVDELVTAVDFAANRCPMPPTPTPTPSSSVTPTATLTPEVTPMEPTCPPTPNAATPPPSSACVAAPGAFVDCLATSGFATGSYDGQNGAAVADMDGDGFPDVFFWNPTKREACDDGTSGGFRLLRNLGHDMQFQSVADASFGSLRAITTVAAAFGDLDNDRKPDLVIAGEQATAAYTFYVYHNVGDGTFEEVNDAWGFGHSVIQEPEQRPFGIGLSLVDLNLDGRLDVVEVRRDPEGRPLVFLSQPDGTSWAEAGRDVFGDARGYTWTLFFADLNHDQLQDAFVLNDYWATAPSKYYARVDRSLTYEERELLPVFGTRPYGAPMGAATADLNGDGELDLVVTDTGDQHVFSLGSNVEDAWGVKQNPSRFEIPQNCWSVAVVDLENDGKPDLFFACAGFRSGWPHIAASYVLRNQGGTFEVAAGLLPNEDTPTWEVGLAVADFDQDGRLDFLTGGEGSPPRLLWNQIPGGKALALRLRGKHVNSEGIGARVDVEMEGLPRQARELFPGGATWGYSDSQLLFGMGQATLATVTVDWRPAGGTAVQTVELAPGAWVIEEP